MKSYDRSLVNMPNKLADDEYKKKMYSDVLDENNKVKPRWNTVKENGERVFRKYLLGLTHGCCAYCGKKITDYDMDVEHFLPEGKFPYIAYCLDNMLPSCKYCNQNIKHDFTPKEIKGLTIVEDCAKELSQYDYIYDKNNILNNLCSKTRLIEPTFDKVEDNLEFDSEFYSYIDKTEIGNIIFVEK